MRYEEIDHTGDIGILVYGKTLEELYENAGFAYFDIVCNLSLVEEKEEKTLEVEGETPAELLRNFLVELLLLSQVEGYFCSSFEVLELTGQKLRVIARGEPLDEERHQVHIEIKAVTYHMLEVVREEDQTWRGRVIFDI